METMKEIERMQAVNTKKYRFCDMWLAEERHFCTQLKGRFKSTILLILQEFTSECIIMSRHMRLISGSIHCDKIRMRSKPEKNLNAPPKPPK
ncbi:hypothetical protein Bca4012_077226 [Brassica carinata]